MRRDILVSPPARIPTKMWSNCPRGRRDRVRHLFPHRYISTLSSMKLYKLSQSVNYGYDTYDSCVVCAENEEEAKRIHPSYIWTEGGYYDEEKKEFWTHNVNGEPYLFENKYGGWTNDLNEIRVEFLGNADDSVKKGIVCASFNAG